jgi:hypothetical protein
MSTLEEEIVRPLKEQLAQRPLNGSPVLPTKFPILLRWWHHAAAGLLIFAASLGVCGVFQLKATWENVWRGALQEFQWYVFVSGDSLAADEVGRFLKQLEGVRDVIYQSPDDAMQRFRGDKLARPLDLLNENPFPPAWRVTWEQRMIGSSKMQDEFEETLALPGVIDVAYDKQLIEKLRIYRLQWLQSRWILSAIALVLVLTVAALGALLLIRGSIPITTRKQIVTAAVSDFLCWAAGFALVFLCLGAVPWLLLAGGLAAAAVRWLVLAALRVS